MKIIYELAKLASGNRKVLDFLMPNNIDGPLDQLKCIALESEERDDDEVMYKIYGKKNYEAFAKLKNRLENILVECILFQKLSHENKFTRNNQSYDHLRQAISYRIMIDLKAPKLAVKLIEKSISNAIKYHLTDVVIMYSSHLVRYYGASEFNKFKFDKFLLIQSKYARIQKWEIKAEQYYYNLQSRHLNTLNPASDNARTLVKRYVEKLEQVKDLNTYTFKINKFRVNVINYEYEKNYEGILKLCEEIFNEFGPPFRSSTFFQIVLIRKMWALIQTDRNDEAITNGLELLDKVPTGSLGWYYVAHYTIKAQLYNGDYIQGVNLINQALSHSNFQKISENLKEVFKTTFGYAHLIIEAGMVGNPESVKKNISEFKLYKFLNTIPVFSKDKRGLNVTILLMHIGFLLLRKDYNGIIDRVDSLNAYANRHLRKDDTFRSNCMIKMVIQMTKADFNPIRTARYTEDLFKKLQDVKLAGSGENIETEIIPYEVLWQIMLKACEDNSAPRKRKLVN